MCPLLSTICPTHDVGQLPPQRPDGGTSDIRRNLLGPDTLSQPFQLREFRTGQLVGVMASSIRDLQILAQQHFAVRDPVIATDGAALIGSDGYLMSLRRDAVVVAVPRHVWLPMTT
jgi:hypothetical protein